MQLWRKDQRPRHVVARRHIRSARTRSCSTPIRAPWSAWSRRCRRRSCTCRCAASAPGHGGPGLGFGHHPVARRHRAHQQPRGRRAPRAIELALTDARRVCRARARPRPRYRHRRAAGRDQRPPAGGAARQFQEGQARPDRHRHRQSAGLRVDGDGRHRQRRRPLAARAERPPDRRRHPDRRGPQSRQLRRAARQLARRGDRRQHRRHHGRAGHLLLGRLQHRPACAHADPAARPRAPRPARHRRRPGAPAAAPARSATGLTQEAGVRVVEVQPGSPAQAGGLEPGDVIVGARHRRRSPASTTSPACSTAPRSTSASTVRILRDGRLGERRTSCRPSACR